ncbi:helix-turn-helix domain-containing protein [Roseovarius tibetensis]|uniref:helix-turn-helix domain-containing protein n=1 Tax=Roseovarius tibetensis TaxID=2685897 RepID=UPI003D7FF8DC
MSHAATNWAIQQRGLKPTTKIVLWHLCDRFNPDYGCFPSQSRLAHDCEISRSTLNEHLALLETARLLRRVKRLHPVTKRQMPTRYILGFEPGFTPDTPDPCPETGHGIAARDADSPEPDERAPEAGAAAVDTALPCPRSGHGSDARPVSDFGPDPCPENGPTRVRNPDTNPVREPLREPVKEEEDARAREFDFDRFFAELLNALGFAPNAALPAWWQGWPPREHVRRWRDDLDLSAEAILAVAEETRHDHPDPPDGPKALDRAMQRAAQRQAQRRSGSEKPKDRQAGRRRGRKTASGPPPSDDELAAFYAGMVNSDQFLPPNMISTTMRDAMLARGLVTADRLRARGVL